MKASTDVHWSAGGSETKPTLPLIYTVALTLDPIDLEVDAKGFEWVRADPSIFWTVNCNVA
jgi:hypothetical protein